MTANRGWAILWLSLMPSDENLKHRFNFNLFEQERGARFAPRPFYCDPFARGGVVLDLYPAPDMQRARLPLSKDNARGYCCPAHCQPRSLEKSRRHSRPDAGCGGRGQFWPLWYAHWYGRCCDSYV